MRPSVVSPRLPFFFPSLCVSFILSMGVILLDPKFLRGLRSKDNYYYCAAFTTIHHVYMFVFSIQHPTTLMERNSHLSWLLTVRKCKFYVGLLLIPLFLAIANAYTSIISTRPKYKDPLPVWFNIVVAFQAIVVFLLIAMATYPEEEGLISLDTDDLETATPPQHWLRKAVGSRYSINPALPFSLWVLALCSFTSAHVLILSILEDGQSSGDLNTMSASLALFLIIFIFLAYTDSRYGEEDSKPYLYTHLPPASDFVRIDMRYIYLALSAALSASFLAGGTMTLYYGNGVLLGIVEGALAIGTGLLMGYGMVLPLFRDLEVWASCTGRMSLAVSDPSEQSTVAGEDADSRV